MRLTGKEKRKRRRELRSLKKSGELSKKQVRDIKNDEFRDGQSAVSKILKSYVAPAVIGGAGAFGAVKLTSAIKAKKALSGVGKQQASSEIAAIASSLPGAKTPNITQGAKPNIWDKIGKGADKVDQAKNKVDDALSGVSAVLNGSESTFKAGVANDRAKRGSMGLIPVLIMALIGYKMFKK